MGTGWVSIVGMGKHGPGSSPCSVSPPETSAAEAFQGQRCAAPCRPDGISDQVLTLFSNLFHRGKEWQN